MGSGPRSILLGRDVTLWVVTHEPPLSVGDTPKQTGPIQPELGPTSSGSPKTPDAPGGISILHRAPGRHFLGGGGAELNPACLGAGTGDPLGSRQGEEEEEEAEIARLQAQRWRKDLAPAETAHWERGGKGGKNPPKAPQERQSRAEPREGGQGLRQVPPAPGPSPGSVTGSGRHPPTASSTHKAEVFFPTQHQDQTPPDSAMPQKPKNSLSGCFCLTHKRPPTAQGTIASHAGKNKPWPPPWRLKTVCYTPNPEPE